MEEKNNGFPEKIHCDDVNEFEKIITRLNDDDAKFITLSSLIGGDGEHILIYYFKVAGKTITVHLRPKKKSVPSLYSTFVKADFIEREINNTFGIKFLGHPNLERIQGAQDVPQKRRFFLKNREKQ